MRRDKYKIMMEAILRAEKGKELLFLAVLTDTHCVCFPWWPSLRVVDAAISHAASVLMAIMLIL